MLCVAVECLRCGHRGRLSPEQLESHGIAEGTSLVLITRRLTCRVCGSRSFKAFRVDDDDPTLVPSDAVR